jgi:hypothetical protein
MIKTFEEFLNERIFVGRKVLDKDKILIYKSLNYEVYQVLTFEGAKELGINTKWKISSEIPRWNFLLKNNTIYFIVDRKLHKDNSLYKILVLVDKENKIKTYNSKDDEIHNTSLNYLPIDKKIFIYNKG